MRATSATRPVGPATPATGLGLPRTASDSTSPINQPTEADFIARVSARLQERLRTAHDPAQEVRELGKEMLREQILVAGDLVASGAARDAMQRCQGAAYELTEASIQPMDLAAGERSCSLEGMNALFWWGMDVVLCREGEAREEGQGILQIVQSLLDSRAKQSRAQAFQILAVGNFDLALRELQTCERDNLQDFGVLRALGALYLQHRAWAHALSYYEAAASAASPYSQRETGECHLGASLACRLGGDWAAALDHSAVAKRHLPQSLVTKYEHAINYFGAFRQGIRVEELPGEKLLQAGLDLLREVVSADLRYAPRLLIEEHFSPFRENCEAILAALREDLYRSVKEATQRIKFALAEAEEEIGSERFNKMGSEVRASAASLEPMLQGNGVFDGLEARDRIPSVLGAIRDLRMLAAQANWAMATVESAIEQASVVVGPLGVESFPWDSEASALRRLYQQASPEGYKELGERAVALEERVYRYCLVWLEGIQRALDAQCRKSREELTELQEEAKVRARIAQRGPFGLGTGFVGWIVVSGIAVFVLGANHLMEGKEAATAFGGGLILVLIVHSLLKSMLKSIAASAERRAKEHENNTVKRYQEILDQLEESAQKCRRRERFALPPSVSILMPHVAGS